MHQDAPTLVLSDIVHGLTPSPAPQDDPHSRSPSPEVLHEHQVAAIRKTALDLSVASISSRERELVDMILKLTFPTNPTQSQIISQAETIAILTEQRTFLVQEAEEQRARWESERVGWDRMAEALISLKWRSNKKGEGTSGYANDSATHELERHYAGVETDNRALRLQLNNAQNRLATLESQLTHLRPLLLARPTISQETYELAITRPKPTGSSNPNPEETQTHSDTAASPRQQLPSPSYPKTHYPSTKRSHNHKSKGKEKDRHKSGKVTTTMNDARAEHILLAARKLGRQRAYVVGGLVRVEKEKARQARRAVAEEEEKEKEPKTPKRTTGKTDPGPSGSGRGIFTDPIRGIFPHPHPDTNTTPSSSSYNTFPVSPSLPTPTANPTTPHTQTRIGKNPPTPLDSLLSAARSMMVDDSDSNSDSDRSRSGGRTPGKRKSKSKTWYKPMPESPIPPTKRRKVSGDKEREKAMRQRALGGEKVRSALDVLADQAAAFRTGKGKGKERDLGVVVEGVGEESLHEHGMSRSRTPMAENGTWSSLKPVRWGQEGEVGSSSPVWEDGIGVEEEEDELMDDDGEEEDSSGKRLFEGSENKADEQSAPSPDSDPQPQSRLQTHTDLHDPSNLGADSTASSRAVPDLGSSHPLPSTLDGPSTSELRRRAHTHTDSDSAPAHAHTHTRHKTAPELSMDGLTTMPEFEEEGEDGGKVGGRGYGYGYGSDAPGGKKRRSPYVKWSKEEDDLLSQAVAKYGQKWDMVQTMLPARGYHQVRQRWLRKLGVFDAKPDLSAYQTGAMNFAPGVVGAGARRSSSSGSPGPGEGLPQPKLGLAPLSSEMGYTRR